MTPIVGSHCFILNHACCQFFSLFDEMMRKCTFSVAAQEKEVPTVRLEEGMVLECVCPWNGNLTQVSWTKVSDRTPLVVFHPQIGMAPSHHYADRIEFLKRTPKDGSISLRNVTHQDIGTYRCSIQMFPQGSWTTTVRVEDLGNVPVEIQFNSPLSAEGEWWSALLQGKCTRSGHQPFVMSHGA